MGTLGRRTVQLKPYDPVSKRIVERINRYLETSFLPGRTIASPADFSAQWLSVANGRRLRAIDGRLVDLFGADRPDAGLLPVPPVIDTVTAVWLGRDYYVRVAGNDYSVDPPAIGQLVDVRISVDQVRVSRAGRALACH